MYAKKRTFTVVVEFTIEDTEIDRMPFPSTEMESRVSSALHNRGFNFRIMETIEAPYGPQHSGGVFIAEKGKLNPPFIPYDSSIKKMSKLTLRGTQK